ncbi:carbohydrate binding domain-containing protein [Actinoplanes sp. NPDC026619]|uniref:carbohydrate binding domain-containing protein n=1 Tax=Actinoplanes sp. NPDC026619 TaxID=3155798 RepID=UPI0033D0474B
MDGLQLSRRGLLAATAAGTSLVLVHPSWSGADSRPATSLTVQPAAFGAIYGSGAHSFTVRGGTGPVRWRVRDLWGATIAEGAGRDPRPNVTDGYYRLEVTAGPETVTVPFAVLAPYRLPADSPFGINTHLQPPEMVALLTALGTTWVRTDLTWTEIEPPPLAGWTPFVYQADATVELDTAVAHSGHSSVKVVNRSAKQPDHFASFAQEVMVQPNTAYAFGAWVKGEDVHALQFTVKGDWSSRIDAPAGTYGWTKVSFDYTTGAESTLTFRVIADDLVGAAWLDDLSMTAAGSATNLLVNPGFEKGLASGYTFDTYDPYLNALKAGGVHPLPIVDYANPLYDGGDTPYSDAGRQAFGKYVTATLQHYRRRFTAVEVYNEWNAGWFTTGPADGDAGYYTKLLETTYRAIKATDPTITVVGGVTFGTALDWMTAVFQAGGMAYLDAVSNHPYTGAPESGVPLDEAERQVTALIKQFNNGAAKPVWISELGWSLADQQTTAAYLVRGLVLALAGGVQKFFWYDLVGDQNFGLLDQAGDDYRPRPAYVAYATAIRLLTGRKPTSAADGDHRFGDLAVLWSADSRKPVEVATTRPVVLTDVTGTSTTLYPSGGRVHLTLTGTPVYLATTAAVTPGGRIDVTAPGLVRTADGAVPFTCIVDNTGSAHAADLSFTTLGVTTRVRAAAGKRAEVTAAVPVDRLDYGRNTVVTWVGEGGQRIGRLVSSVVVVQVPAGEVAAVGTVDWSDAELALAPAGYADYPARFPQDVSFTIGADGPARSWPYIHPGPDDGWAGGRAHTFTLTVPLAAAPAGDLKLVVFLVDTHNTAPGTVQVALNGGTPVTVTLPAGSGAGATSPDGGRTGQFSVALPQSQLVAGPNQITLTKNSGSWMVYDAVGIYRS